MKRLGIWFNVSYLKRVKKDVFIKHHKHLNATPEQLTEVWDSVNPPKKDQKASKDEAPEK